MLSTLTLSSSTSRYCFLLRRDSRADSLFRSNRFCLRLLRVVPVPLLLLVVGGDEDSLLIFFVRAADLCDGEALLMLLPTLNCGAPDVVADVVALPAAVGTRIPEAAMTTGFPVALLGKAVSCCCCCCCDVPQCTEVIPATAAAEVRGGELTGEVLRGETVRPPNAGGAAKPGVVFEEEAPALVLVPSGLLLSGG